MAKTVGIILEQKPVLNGIQFDILSSRVVENSQTVTQHPVENGAVISDHVIKNPVKISLRAEVGNVQLTGDYQVGQKAQDVHGALKLLYKNSELFDYQANFELYKNIIITALTVVDYRDKPAGLIADIKLQQLEVTASEQVKIPQEQLGTTKAAIQLASPIKAGRVEAEPSTVFEIGNI